MTEDVAHRAPDLRTLVVVGSLDLRLGTALSNLFAQATLQVELQVVAPANLVAYLDEVLADLVIFEGTGEILKTILAKQPAEGTPVVVVCDTTQGPLALAVGATAFVSGVDASSEPLLLAVLHTTQCVSARHAGHFERSTSHARRVQNELDQTRQRAAQVERMRALGELSAGVAHDFNNALGTILGRISLAREKLSRGEVVHDDLAVLELAAQHAAQTVQRIQAFSRPSEMDTWQDITLPDLLREAAGFVHTRVPRHVRLRVDADANTPVVRGNPGELREVLINLLRNALDAVGERGEVTIRCFGEAEHAVIEVRDDGHGMPDTVRARIFEPFFSTKATHGTGLGLSVSHWILRRHDAQIHVESTPNQGTLFRLVFEPFRATAPAALPAPGRKDVLSILVVDDDATVADMLHDLLTEQGHQVRVVGRALEALEVLKDLAVDLVITDLDLPDLGGWQLARRVREVRPSVLVGMVTGWPLGASSEELHARGVNFVLAKPFTIDALDAALKKATG